MCSVDEGDCSDGRAIASGDLKGEAVKLKWTISRKPIDVDEAVVGHDADIEQRSFDFDAELVASYKERARLDDRVDICFAGREIHQQPNAVRKIVG